MRNLPLLFILIIPVISCNSPAGNDNTSNTADTTIAMPVNEDTVTSTAPYYTKITRTYHNITILPTTDASVGVEEKDEYEYEDSNLVDKMDRMYDQIATFGTAERIWLAPKDWTGHGDLYTNNGVGVRLYPVGGNDSMGPRIMYTMECNTGYVNKDAAPFFPEAMTEYQENYNYLPAAILPKGTKLKRISSAMATYTMPSDSGLITRGVVFYGAYNPDDEPFFREVRVILPADQSAIMDYLMKWYIDRLQ